MADPQKKSGKQPEIPSRKLITIEVFNAVTHGIAAMLSIIGTVFLVKKGIHIQSWVSIVAYIIYGLSLVLLFTNSTLYHSFSFSKYRPFFQKIDHSSIYLLIAGTYTPYLMISLASRTAYLFLAIIWALALAGIVFELIAIDRYPKLSTYMYLTLGWLGILIVYPLIKTIEFNGVLLLALGGIVYSLGTIFYRMKDNRWMHVIWHLFVVGGAAIMFLSILRYV